MSTNTPGHDRRRWALLGGVLLFTFLVLGFFGREVYRQAPPIPSRVVTAGGETVTTSEEILTGQTVWQSAGGQQLGSIWGHGAYQAPDWTADQLHREALALLDVRAEKEGARDFASLPAERQAVQRAALVREMRTNTFDAATGTVTISPERAEAIRRVASHYDRLFGGAPELKTLRQSYAMTEATVPDAGRRKALTAFFFWTSWAAATERLGQAITYTNNWPHEPLIENRPSGANVVWSFVSIVLLLAGVGAVVWWQAFREKPEPPVTPPASDPLAPLALTPSMRACGKYVGTVLALLAVQVGLGALTAHYTVEGQALFGLPIGQWLPYSLTRTWHLQTGVFWIATAFLAAGLFLAPVIGGHEPKLQRLGVNVLWGALLLVVAGSMAGEYLAIHQALPLDLSFWLGTQGYEYVDLGRA